MCVCVAVLVSSTALSIEGLTSAIDCIATAQQRIAVPRPITLAAHDPCRRVDPTHGELDAHKHGATAKSARVVIAFVLTGCCTVRVNVHLLPGKQYNATGLGKVHASVQASSACQSQCVARPCAV